MDEELSFYFHFLKKVFLSCITLLILCSIIFGAIHLVQRKIETDAEREIFKQSITYNEGVLDDLAKYKYEYDTAEDNVEKEAIASVVRNRFANYDKSKIENKDLRIFLEDCGL